MPSGKAGWSDEDSRLYWSEQCVSRMRVAVSVKGEKPAHMRLSGAAYEGEPSRLQIPCAVWLAIRQPITDLAILSGLAVRILEWYTTRPGTVTVHFERDG